MAFNPKECGLKPVNSVFTVNNNKNFGPRRFYANPTVRLLCDNAGCPLLNAVEVRSSTVFGATEAEVKQEIKSQIKDPGEELARRIASARISNCPAYQDKFSQTQAS